MILSAATIQTPDVSKVCENSKKTVTKGSGLDSCCLQIRLNKMNASRGSVAGDTRGKV